MVTARGFILTLLGTVITPWLLQGCSMFDPPFNNFKPTLDSTLSPVTKPGRNGLIRSLSKQDIQYVEYGDTMTLLIPTDHYFVKGTPDINDICYEGLNNVVKLLKFYPKCKIFVAAFTDNIGTPYQKYHLTTARAQAMLTFLWASHIPAQSLKATGYSSLFAIGDNAYIHGAAYNRRIEIQWSKACEENEAMHIAPSEMKK